MTQKTKLFSITIEPDVYAALLELAAGRSKVEGRPVSVATVVREGVELLLKEAFDR